MNTLASFQQPVLPLTNRLRPPRCVSFLLCLVGCLLAPSLPAASPSLLARWPGHSKGPAFDVDVDNHRAYVATTTGGLIILDVSDPALPRPIGGFVPTPYDYCSNVRVQGNRAYLLTGSSGVQVIDLTNPARPSFLTSLGGFQPADVLPIGSYAYVTTFGGLSVHDLTDIANPQELATLSFGGFMHLEDHRLYVCSDNGFRILDVQNPAQPTSIGGFFLPGYTRGIAAHGSLVAVAHDAELPNPDSLILLDASNPAAPVVRGSWPGLSGYSCRIAVTDSHAFVTDCCFGLLVIDIHDPAHPALAATYATNSPVYGVCLDEDRAYVAADEDGLAIVNVATPSQPTLLGTYHTSGSTEALTLQGDLAGIADGTAGLHLLNLSDPAKPTWLASHDTPGNVRQITFDGSLAYVADGPGGLRILSLTNPASPTLVSVTPIEFSDARDVALIGHYACVANGNNGLRILDVQNPANPAEVAFYLPLIGMTLNAVETRPPYAFLAWGYQFEVIDLTNPLQPQPIAAAFLGGDAPSLSLDGSRACLSTVEGGVEIFDISNPHSLTPILAYQPSSQPSTACLQGTNLYLGFPNLGLEQLDISNPLAPVTTATSPLPQQAFQIMPSGQVLLVADGLQGLLVLGPGVPPHFSTLRCHPDGTFTLQITGSAGQPFNLEYSVNLKDWYFLSSFILGDSPATWSDIQYTECFFRLVLP